MRGKWKRPERPRLTGPSAAEAGRGSPGQMFLSGHVSRRQGRLRSAKHSVMTDALCLASPLAADDPSIRTSRRPRRRLRRRSRAPARRDSRRSRSSVRHQEDHGASRPTEALGSERLGRAARTAARHRRIPSATTVCPSSRCAACVARRRTGQFPVRLAPASRLRTPPSPRRNRHRRPNRNRGPLRVSRYRSTRREAERLRARRRG